MRARLVAVVGIGALLVGAGAVFLPSPATATPQAPGHVSVEIMGYAFSQKAISVPVGTTVTWTNHDTAPHNVVSSSGGTLHSPTLQTGQSWSYTFNTAGTFSYYCQIHPDMTGTVTVTPTTTPTTSPPTTSPTTPTTAPPGSCPSGGLLAAVLDPFWAHFQGAHLETSVGQQLADALDVDKYVQTHTVLVEHMLAPAYSTLSSALDGLTPFWVHLQGAHLQTPVGQQVADALNVDKYVQTHTVLVEHMLDPAVGSLTGSC